MSVDPMHLDGVFGTTNDKVTSLKDALKNIMSAVDSGVVLNGDKYELNETNTHRYDYLLKSDDANTSKENISDLQQMVFKKIFSIDSTQKQLKDTESLLETMTTAKETFEKTTHDLKDRIERQKEAFSRAALEKWEFSFEDEARRAARDSKEYMPVNTTRRLQNPYCI